MRRIGEVCHSASQTCHSACTAGVTMHTQCWMCTRIQCTQYARFRRSKSLHLALGVLHWNRVRQVHRGHGGRPDGLRSCWLRLRTFADALPLPTGNFGRLPECSEPGLHCSSQSLCTTKPKTILYTIQTSTAHVALRLSSRAMTMRDRCRLHQGQIAAKFSPIRGVVM